MTFIYILFTFKIPSNLVEIPTGASSIMQRIKPISTSSQGVLGVLKNAAAAAAAAGKHASPKLGANENKLIAGGTREAGVKRDRYEDPLERLFRKTLFTPPLFWKPVSDSAVEERRKRQR